MQCKQRYSTQKELLGVAKGFDLYRDDGNTYAYEQGKFDVTHLRWSQATGKLQHTGAALPQGSPARVEVIAAAAK
ncbi:MAG: DUF5110 domain-containing protein [Acidobacteriaceae bacterium]